MAYQHPLGRGVAIRPAESPDGITHKPDYNYQTDFDEIRRMKSNKGIYQVAPKDLPDLVTFADVADPNSVMVVDGEHPDATLEPGVAWQAITIQIGSWTSP